MPNEVRDELANEKTDSEFVFFIGSISAHRDVNAGRRCRGAETFSRLLFDFEGLLNLVPLPS